LLTRCWFAWPQVTGVPRLRRSFLLQWGGPTRRARPGARNISTPHPPQARHPRPRLRRAATSRRAEPAHAARRSRSALPDVVVNQQVIAAELYNALGEVANPPWGSTDVRLRQLSTQTNTTSTGGLGEREKATERMMGLD